MSKNKNSICQKLYTGFTSCLIRYVWVCYLHTRIAAYWQSPKHLYVWRERLTRMRNIFKFVFSSGTKRLFLKWIRHVSKPVVTTKRVHVVAWNKQFQATKLPGKGFSSKGNQTTSQPVVLVNNQLWTKETLWMTKNPWK